MAGFTETVPANGGNAHSHNQEIHSAVSLRIVPLDFDKDGKPRNEKLYAAAQAYYKREFDSEIVLLYYARLWAVVADRLDDPEYFEVVGLMGIRNTIDVCLFHLTPISPDKDGMKLAEQARDMMVYRGWSYLQDLGNSGHPALIHVDERAARIWRRFLGRIKAKPANRWEVVL